MREAASNRFQHLRSKVLLNASKERSLSSPPALGVQAQVAWKSMQTLSWEKVDLQWAVTVALTPQAPGTMTSAQEAPVYMEHQPVPSLEGSTGPTDWAEAAATRAREATANFMVGVLVTKEAEELEWLGGWVARKRNKRMMGVGGAFIYL